MESRPPAGRGGEETEGRVEDDLLGGGGRGDAFGLALLVGSEATHCQANANHTAFADTTSEYFILLLISVIGVLYEDTFDRMNLVDVLVIIID